MLAAHWNGQRLQLDDAYPTPRADAQMALVRVRLAGICSTDLQIFQGRGAGNQEESSLHLAVGPTPAITCEASLQ